MPDDIIFYNNKWKDATISASSEALPASNVQTSQLYEKWRTSNLTAPYIKADFGSEQLIRILHIQSHNLTTGATIRIRLSNNSDMSSPAYDNTFYAWQAVSGWDEGGWDEGGWDGVLPIDLFDSTAYRTTIALDQLLSGTLVAATGGTFTTSVMGTKFSQSIKFASFSSRMEGATIRITGGTGSGQSRIITGFDTVTNIGTIGTLWATVPDSTSTFEIDLSQQKVYTANDGTYAARYMRLDITDSANEAGYIQAGWIGAGDYFQPTYGVDFNTMYQYVDPSPKTRTLGGNIQVATRKKYRVVNINYSFLHENETLNDIEQIANIVGSNLPIVYAPFLDNSQRMYTNTVFGFFTQPPGREQIRKQYNHYSYRTSLQIEEQI